MSNATSNLILRPYGQGGRNVVLPVDGGSHIYAGTMQSVLTGTGMLVPGSTVGSGACVGVSTHEQDATSVADSALRCDIITDQVFCFTNSAISACSEATLFGAVVYMENDHVISATNTGALFAAGYFVGMEPDGRVRVLISMRAMNPADLVTLATSSGAGLVGILDSGNHTAQTTVEAALQELYVQSQTANASFGVPLASLLDPDGDPLAKYSAGNTGVAGFTLADSKAVALRWNNYPGNPGVVAIGEFAIPKDIDDASTMILEFLCSKTGATAGDATKITVGAFLTVAGDLHDADTDCGGDTDAMVDTATAKTTKLLTRTIAAADIQPGAVSCSFTLMPKSGTIETDDVILHAMRVRYTRKLQTS